MSALRKSVILDHVDAATRSRLGCLEVFSEIDSTNSYLLNQSISIGSARVCVTDYQIAGRGRHGKVWESDKNENVMLSLSWGFPQWPSTLTGLGLAVALMVAERINLNYQLDAKIKWPNDLMVEDKKIAGILIDVSGQANKACNVVIGLGLNVYQADRTRQSVSYAWQDLKSLGVDVNRNALIGQIISDLILMLGKFEEDGFAAFMAPWNALSCYSGRLVDVIAEEEVIRGVEVGVDELGSLLVESEDNAIHCFSSNNVSVRLVRQPQ